MVQDPHSLYPQQGPPVPGADPKGPAETQGYRLNHTMVRSTTHVIVSAALEPVCADPNRRSRENDTFLPRCVRFPPCDDFEQRTLFVRAARGSGIEDGC